jgi:hypothetical protein
LKSDGGRPSGAMVMAAVYGRVKREGDGCGKRKSRGCDVRARRAVQRGPAQDAPKLGWCGARQTNRDTMWRRSEGRRPDVRRSHIDGEKIARSRKRIGACELTDKGMGQQVCGGSRADAAAQGSV